MTFLQDLRFGARMLVKSPAFALVAVFSLALGVAANTAMLSVMNAVVLRPYSFGDLEHLMLVRPQTRVAANEQRLAPADFLEVAADRKTFQSAAAFRFSEFNLARNGEADSAQGYRVSPELFSMLGVAPLKGRTFFDQEGQPGGDNVIILSYGLWQRRFGGDPAILGSAVAVDGQNATVVGIMPEHFIYPLGAEMWKPLALTPAERADHGKPTVFVLARLTPGINQRGADEALGSLSARLERDFPATNTGRIFTLLPLRKEQYEATVPLLVMLQAAALFVLVLACANLINLLIIRAIARKRELAVRAALGASRARLVQLFTSETALLCFAAATAAIVGSIWSVQAIRDSLSPSYTKWIAGWQAMRLDARTLAAALAIALALALLLGGISGLSAARLAPQEGLREGGRSGGARHSSRLRSALVVTQLAIALALLAGSGLMISGFRQLQRMYSPLDPEHVLVFSVSLPETRYPQAAHVNQFYDQLLSGIDSLPGVEGAGIIANPPASNVDTPRAQFTIVGQPTPRPSDMPAADRQFVSPAALSVARVPLIEGRMLAQQDGPASPRVAVISRALAQLYWPDQSPLNRQVRFSASEPPITIVGVVGELKVNWFDQAPHPAIYLPYAQTSQRRASFLVRTAGSPLDIAASVRRLALALDPGLSLGGLRPFAREVEESIAPVRIMGMLMLVFGALALVLAAVGIYAAIAHGVQQRRHEFGVRMALGADRADVLKLVLRSVSYLALAGLAIGLGLTIALVKLAASFVSANVSFSVGVFALASVLLLGVSVASGMLPARAAIEVDPAIALRAD